MDSGSGRNPHQSLVYPASQGRSIGGGGCKIGKFMKHEKNKFYWLATNKAHEQQKRGGGGGYVYDYVRKGDQ